MDNVGIIVVTSPNPIGFQIGDVVGLVRNPTINDLTFLREGESMFCVEADYDALEPEIWTM